MTFLVEQLEHVPRSCTNIGHDLRQNGKVVVILHSYVGFRVSQQPFMLRDNFNRLSSIHIEIHIVLALKTSCACIRSSVLVLKRPRYLHYLRYSIF